jgi:hypothetical protein
MEQTCGLTEDQADKLRLAGRGDFKEFFRLVNEKRREWRANCGDQNRLDRIHREVRPLRERWVAEPFLEGSFFSKSLAKTLNQSQIAKYDAAVSEMKELEHRDLIEFFVWAETGTLRLNDEQCRRLKELLTTETRHSRRMPQFRYRALLVQTSRIPEARIKPIFDVSQWGVLCRQFDEAKRSEMEPHNVARFVLQHKLRAVGR